MTKTPRRPRFVVNFSPKGGCVKALTDAFDRAKHQIRVAIYEFNQPLLRDALLRAKQRGVDVGVLADKRVNLGNPHSACLLLAKSGVTVLLDTKHRIMHNKYAVIDGKIVLTGSFNYTTEAEHEHAENLIEFHNGSLAGSYLANWALLAGNSMPMPMPV